MINRIVILESINTLFYNNVQKIFSDNEKSATLKKTKPFDLISDTSCLMVTATKKCNVSESQ